jgi:hemoglobin-like flavoprotein
MLSQDTISKVQSSFSVVAMDAPTFTAAFYDHLFQLDPSLRPLFKGDLPEQGRKLAAMLATVVRGLHELPAIVPAAKALAARHATYGVQRVHYETVGRALLETLDAQLGERMTPEVRTAWSTTYGLLAQVMIDATASGA